MKRVQACACSMVAVAALLVGSAEYAYGQGLPVHGITIAKGCVSPLCVGEPTDCEVEIGYNDDFGDTIRILSAWDVQDVTGDNVRIPASGNLPIVAVGGNTTCAVAGPLPCLIGPAGSTLSDLPGLAEDGFVRFKQNAYVIEADDPDPLRDQATVEWEDLCDDPETVGCGSGIVNPAPAPASTRITRCDDGNDCTTDTCELGVCTFTPECETDGDCDDGDACTANVCTAEGCCEYPPIVCDDGNDCTTDTCDPATGCVYTPECTTDADCDDMDACTANVCTAEGCCEYPPIVCDDGDACTVDDCDEIEGCVYTPLACDDGNDCTTDTCDPATGCVYTPECTTDADCDDMDACTANVCTAEGCCEYTPLVCDDNDPCTEDTCDSATGCVYTPIYPPPPGCGGGDGCTPGFWKQPHHAEYWVGYSPDDLYNEVFGVEGTGNKTLVEAAWSRGGGESALMRHSVAALLNASSDEVNYYYTVEDVIAMVQEAYATGDFNRIKDMLAQENERGCTVDKSLSGGSRSETRFRAK